MSYQVSKSDDEWREELGSEQFQVLREAATERPWTGELLDEERGGIYTCGACNAELFKSGTKFDSGCGWPSFYESVRPEAVQLIADTTLGHGAHRGALRQLRLAPRPRLPRRLRHADRRPLLHELDRAQLHARRLSRGFQPSKPPVSAAPGRG